MQQATQLINRRTRKRLHAATAVLSLVLWLAMLLAENWTPFHTWLHGGAIPDDDDCAIVAIAHGKVETGACEIPVAVPVAWIEAIPQVRFSVFSRPVETLLSGRSPPVFLTVS